MLAIALILVSFYHVTPVIGLFLDLVGRALLDHFFDSEATKWCIKFFGVLLSVPIFIGIGGLGIHAVDRERMN